MGNEQTYPVEFKEELIDIIHFLQICYKILHFDDDSHQDLVAFLDILTAENIKLLYRMAADDRLNRETDGVHNTAAATKRFKDIDLLEKLVPAVVVVGSNAAQTKSFDRLTTSRGTRIHKTRGSTMNNRITTTTTTTRAMANRPSRAIQGKRATADMTDRTRRIHQKKTSGRSTSRAIQKEVYWC